MAGVIKYGMSMTLVNGTLTDAYNQSGLTAEQAAIGNFVVRNVQTITTGSSSNYGISNNGATAIPNGAAYVTVTGAGWGFTPTSIVASVAKPAGGDNIFATVREDSITSDGFIADLSAPTTTTGYVLSYAVTESTVVGAAGDTLELGGVNNPGLALFLNLDAVNYVEVGVRVSSTFYPFLKLMPGQYSGPMFLGTSAPCAVANTSPVKLFYIIYNR